MTMNLQDFEDRVNRHWSGELYNTLKQSKPK